MILNIFRAKKFSIYIAKDILKNFLIMFLGLLLLFFAVDFFEVSKDVKEIENGLKIAIQIVLFRIPNLLENILHFIILLAGLFTFYKLSNNSEIVIMRSNGRSIFQIVKFPAFIAFLFGIFIIAVYNPVSATLNAKSVKLKNIYLKNEKEDLFEAKNGFWFKQKNMESGSGYIIIKASKVYRELLVFNDVILIFTDENNNFIKRINVNIMKLNDDHWNLIDNYIIQKGEETEFIKELELQTNLTKSFISKTIQNNYESIYNIPFWTLRSSIRDLKESGFDSRKFEIRYYYMLTLPFLFAIMVLISAYFGIIHNRENKKYVSIIKGIAVGFVVFITHNIVFELTSANKLTIFDGSILIVLIFITLTICLLIKKDALSNFNY
ncbi:MAG TPA: LptF/LptG family permease [Rickettsiales bacterium]|nr:LptF/LptG family permease [Rickettsiales bacterium]